MPALDVAQTSEGIPPRSFVVNWLTRDMIIGTATVAVLLAYWEVGARVGLFDARVLPPPTAIVGTVQSMIVRQNLIGNCGLTIFRFLAGLALGFIPAVFVGITIGIFPTFRAMVYPLIAILGPVPRIALFPLILILVGLNESSNLIMIALGPFFPTAIAVAGAVTSVDKIYRKVAHNFRAKPRHLYLNILLPAVAPSIMDSLRISVGLALLGTVAVEFLVGNTGLGYLIWNSWNVLSLSQSMAGIVISAAIGFFFYYLVDLIQFVLLPWHRPETFA